MVRIEKWRGSNSGDMCQAAAETGGTSKDSESDDGLKWEEFFDTSVDITSALLDMFDTMVAKNSPFPPDRPDLKTPVKSPLTVDPSTPSDPGGTNGLDNVQHHKKGSFRNSTGRRPVRTYNKRSYSDSTFHEKKRPLSTSSVSSSSSSSSSSLPRNGLEVKRSYLASIESLDDDVVEDCGGHPGARTLGSRDCSNSSLQTPSSVNRPRWCDPNLSHTDRVVLEIIDTERTYVRDLNEIIEGYLKEIGREYCTKISDTCLKELFSNIEDIHRFNSCFVEELDDHGLDPVAVARCFVKNSDGFEVYTQYCTNYPRTVSVLTELMGNSETAEIFKERQTALQHNLPLGSYLLKPVQRILKYHLLLQNLVKHSDKEQEGYSDIKNALSVMTGIAYHINDMKRKHEHAVRVQEIQSLLYGWEGQDLTTYGELVAEGTFRMYRAKASRHLFLFDKMLLIAKKKEEGILSYKTHIMCSNLMLIESIQGEPLCFHVIPFDNPRHQYTFQARNLEQKREWCLQLKRVILENYNAVIPSHARQLVMELGQSKQEDTVASEKSTTRRQMSAPEYLEKRKQERRKSEMNLNRGFRLKKGSKKGENMMNNKNNFGSMRRKNTQLEASSQDNLSTHSRESWTSQTDCSPDQNHWSNSQSDVNKFEELRPRCYSSSKESFSGLSYDHSLSRDCRLRHSLPEPSLSRRSSNRERRHRPAWRTWNSVPEETTDTENEDVNYKLDVNRLLQFRPSSRSLKNKSHREAPDPSGEYVTFFYAHSYACRDMSTDNVGSIMSIGDSEPEPDFQRLGDDADDASSTASNPLPSTTVHSPKRKGMWSKFKGGHHHKDHSADYGNTTHSWKQSAAIRRVQSFTGMARAKVASIHHNLSFRHQSSSCSEPKSTHHPSDLPLDSILPVDCGDISPTTPATWLKQQEEHMANGGKKSGSLPRSFQLAGDSADSSSECNATSSPSESSQMRLRSEGQRYPHGDQRPFTIASDKLSQADFSEDMEKYMEHLPNEDNHYNFHSEEAYERDTTTGCTNTPAISMENVHSIHPEHKIYHQAASKYSTLKHVLSSMGSKIAGLKATLANSSHDQTDSCSNISIECEQPKGSVGRSSSRTSMRSESEISPKMFTAKLVHSVAKAYSSVMRHKSKKENKCVDKNPEDVKSEKSPVYKSEFSTIGARMAYPLESEYSVPKNCIQPRLFKQLREEVRPDSLFSESSNTTSSSDGDKNQMESSLLLALKKDDGDDTTSDASESSADSYYERTFDAIENALAEDMFRDSAIYSDPEDADFSTVERPNTHASNDHVRNTQGCHLPVKNSCNKLAASPPLELTCKKSVNPTIRDRLRILEENVKSYREDSSYIENYKTHHKLDAEKWCVNDCEESETSSEHSASTVNTVMELGNGISKPIGNPENVRTQPRIKGWVKHVVDKLQGEGRV